MPHGNRDLYIARRGQRRSLLPRRGGGELVFLSGQTPLDKATGKLVEGDVAAQTRQVFVNLKGVLAAAGLSFADVVKVQVFLTDMADFAAMNAVFQEQFAAPYPARSTIGVAALPLGARVEIEMIAARRKQQHGV